jgi:chorismate synthase
MRELIASARAEGDSVGGFVECAIIGLPVGLGEHMFASVEARISDMMFAIPAVKGIEFGRGFESARLFGSENNDPFITDGKTVKTATNNCGGILGGMTNGMPVVFRAAFKPTPSIAVEQDSVSISKMENVKLSIVGRHDPCVVPRAAAALEGAAAIAILDLWLDETNKSGGGELRRIDTSNGDHNESQGLSELRAVIDRCDRTIVEALKERMAAASGVAEYKNKNRLPVLDEKREEQLLEKIRLLAGDEYAEYFVEIYDAVLKTSKEFQKGKIDS